MVAAYYDQTQPLIRHPDQQPLDLYTKGLLATDSLRLVLFFVEHAYQQPTPNKRLL